MWRKDNFKVLNVEQEKKSLLVFAANLTKIKDEMKNAKKKRNRIKLKDLTEISAFFFFLSFKILWYLKEKKINILNFGDHLKFLNHCARRKFLTSGIENKS